MEDSVDNENFRDSVIRRTGELSKLVKDNIRTFEDHFFAARFSFDQQEVRNYIKTCKKRYKFTNERVAKMLGYTAIDAGSSISHALNDTTMSGPLYHRLLLENEKTFIASDRHEGNDLALMYLVYKIGKKDKTEERKTQMNRERFEWIRFLSKTENAQLAAAILEEDSEIVSTLSHELAYYVRKSLRLARYYSIQFKITNDSKDEITFAEKNKQRNKVSTSLESLKPLVNDWLPPYYAYLENIASMDCIQIAVRGFANDE